MCWLDCAVVGRRHGSRVKGPGPEYADERLCLGYSMLCMAQEHADERRELKEQLEKEHKLAKRQADKAAKKARTDQR